MVIAAMKLKDAHSLEESYDQSREHIKKQRYYFANKIHLVKAVVFPLVMYLCESWTINKAEPQRTCFWTVVLEKTFESPLDYKEIKPVNLKGNQSWIVIGRTDAKTEAPVFWPPDAKSQLIGKGTDAGKDWK